MVSRRHILKTASAGLRVSDYRTIALAPKTADAFYLSPEWRSLMASIIAERGRRCEDCGRTGTRIFGDHIIEIKDGGPPLDRRNIRCRCGSCHSRKTAEERAKRMAIRY